MKKTTQTRYQQESWSPMTTAIGITAIIVFAMLADSLINLF